MNTFKKIGDISLCLLAIIGVLITVFYGFYVYFVNQTTIGTNYISDQIAVDVKAAEDLSADELSLYEERWFMQANYYSNDKNNGIELQELNFNYFMSDKLTEADYRATGMQYVGSFSGSSKLYYNYIDVDWGLVPNPDSYVDNRFTYYDTTDGISWNGYGGNGTSDLSSVSTLLNRESNMIIKLDNRAFAIQLDGTRTDGWWIFSKTHYYSYSDVFRCVMNAIETNSAGYGDYYITLDLSEFFSIKEMVNGKYLEDNVTDIIKNYAVLKFHYDENGASRSNQSMFGQIECNSIYDTESIDYWQERMVYTLTEEDLVYRYSESYDGYFVSLSSDTKLLFESMPTTKLLLDFDFTSLWIEEQGYNVVGFDYHAFDGFYIDTMTVKSAPKTIYVKDGAFDNATVKTLKHSDGIIWDGLVDFDGEVVIL